MAVSARNPLFDISRGDFTNVNHPHHRHLFAEDPSQSTSKDTQPNDKPIRQQMHNPESQETDTSKQQNNHNTDKVLLSNKHNNQNINDLDDILEQKMENESIQRHQQLHHKQQLQHREHNILLLYIFVLIFASFVIMLVSKWGRTKLIHFAHRLGIETICTRIYTFISQSVPILSSNNDAMSINIISSPNKANPRKKLHMKDPSESEKLISSSNTDIRTKELFEPRLFGGETSILTSSNAQLLHSWLPIRYNWLDWRLLYDLNVDGSSMLTFYEKCAEKGPLIMIIKDERGYIFGVYIAQTQDLNDKGQKKRFFGGADTFVFRLYPNANKYEWAKINRFFVYFDMQNINNATITIGGGSSPALTLLSNLSKGISAKCDTFNNPQLSSSQEFTCIALEVWGFIDYK